MGSCKSIAGRFGVLAIALIAAGCNQRSAPITVPQGSPPPRAVERAPQQIFRPAPPPVVQARPAPVRPFPQIGTADLPPPNLNPVVSDVGTPPAVPVAPRPQPRPELTDNPYKAFDPLDAPKREPQRIVERPIDPPKIPEPEVAPEPEPPFQPRASDDYATLLGEEPDDAAEERAAPDQPPAQAPRNTGPAAGAGFTGKALVALLVPDSDRRGSVRNAIADGAKLIIGPLFSGSAAAVRPVAQAANVNVIAFTTDQSVLGGGLYSIGFLPETDVNRMISYAARTGQRNIAMLVPDTPFGGVITRAAREAASRSGATIVRAQPFKEDFRSLDVAAREFAGYVETAPQVDSVIMATNGKSLQGLAAFLAFNDVLPTQIKYMGLGLWDDKETFREATLRGGWFPGVDPALKTDFAYRYGQAYGGEPPSIALLGYDAVAVAAALIDNGGFSPQAIVAPSGFNGMSGLFRFRRDGRNERALSILSVGQNAFSVVDPAPRSFSTQVSSLVGG